MKKVIYSFLGCLLLTSVPTASAATEKLHKTEVTVKQLTTKPEGGATSELDFLIRSPKKNQTENWGPLKEVTPKPVRKLSPDKAPATKVLSKDVNIIGQLIYDEGKEYDADNNDWLGFYSMPHSSSEKMTLAGYTNGPINKGGYADFDDKVYRGIYLANFGTAIAYKYLVTFDLNTFETISAEEMSRDNFDLVGFAVAKNPVDGKVYGCYTTSDGSGVFWGTADYLSRTTQKIADYTLNQRLLGLAITEKGIAYGLRETMYGSKKLELVKVNLATGSQEIIANCDLPFRYNFGCCWNEKNQTILATYNTEDQGSGLMEIDPATGKATLIADFNADQEIVNLFVKPDFASKVPEKPTLTMSAPQGSMTASYSLTLPTQLADGTAMSGNVDWRLTLDGETLKEGSDPIGSTLTGTVTVTKTGYADFIAYAYNSNGRSENAKARIFVGKGLAATPQNVVLTWDEATSTMSATWDAVTTSADGGYINPSEITYTVSDLTGTILSENQTATSFSKQITAPDGRTEFAWLITANYDNRSSAPGRSNSIYLGSMRPPYDYDFKLRKEFTLDGYTVIDANGDGTTFAPNGLGARCGHSDQNIAMDDWLVTPGIYLEKGNSYLLTLTAHCYQNTNPEMVEVKCGKAPTVAAMTTNVISQVTIKSNRTDPSILTGVVTPTTSGVWYIGVHAKSTDNKGVSTYHVMIPAISLGEPMDPKSPRAATNVTLHPAVDGSLKAGVSYTAPSSSMGGTVYGGGPTGPTMINMLVYVDDETEPRQTMKVAAGFSGDFPQSIEFDTRGDKKVTVVAETTDGYRSIGTLATAYVGPYEPKQPTNVRLTEVFQPGTVRLEWDAVTKDVKSADLPAGHTTYMIYTLDSEGNFIPKLNEPIAQTFYTFDALPDVTQQRFVQYYVGTYNWDFPSSRHTASNYTPIGVPYQLPVKYSCMDDLNNKACAFASQGNGQFGVGKDSSTVKSQDGDGEFYVGRAQYTNDAAMLRTGIISLVGAKNPEVVLYSYKLADGDRNIVQVSVFSNGYEEVIRFDRHDTMKVGEWNKVRYDLSKWKDKNIQIVVTLGCLNINDNYVDNIVIQDTPDFDLAVESISAPKKVRTNKDFSIQAKVSNIGYKQTPTAKASLYCDGEKIATTEIVSLDVDSIATVEFTSRLDNFAKDGKADYRVEIELDSDTNSANNSSDIFTVGKMKSTLAAPQNLKGSSTSEGNVLSWDAAEAPQEGEYTESFEKGEPWADYFGEWTFIDRDEKPLGTINEIALPGIEHGVTTGSFFVMDVTEKSDTIPSNFNTHSGNRALFSLYRRDNRSVDDFAVSPTLDGSQQTIRFYAKSLTMRYSEQLEVLYSFNDEFKYEDYTKVDGFGTKIVPEEWTEFTALIPAGAKHFAIRSRAANGMMLLVDDVTFFPKAPELLGYNLYRDGNKLNEQPVVETSFTDKTAGGDNHIYHASAVYKEGESELCEPLNLANAGVEDLTVDRLIIFTRDRDILVNGAGDNKVTIAGIDGCILHNSIGDTTYTVPAPGIYIVAVGNDAVKVVVR